MAQQARGIGDAAGPDAWFRDLPIVTRYWFGGSLFCTLAVNFEIVSPQLIPFVWHNVSSKLELWRLLSCFLYVGGVCIVNIMYLWLLFGVTPMPWRDLRRPPAFVDSHPSVLKCTTV